MKISQRVDLDQKITSKNHTTLSGSFDCTIVNTPLENKSSNHVLSSYDSIHLQAISRKLIRVEKFKHGVLIDTSLIPGKFKNGYFKTKRNWETHFNFGPLVWTLQDHYNYIGLTKDHNLVFIHLDGGSIGFLLLFPFMTGNSHQYALEYPPI